MNKKTQNQKAVGPKNTELVNRRYGTGACRRAWIALGGRVGAEIGKNPFGRPLYEINGSYKMCIQGELQMEETVSFQGGSDQCAALSYVLEIAIKDFKERTGCREANDLNRWKMAIVSDEPEFLESLPSEVQHGELGLKYHRELKAVEVEKADMSALVSSEEVSLLLS